MRLSGRRRQTGQDVFDQRTGASIRRGREAGRIVLAEQLNLCGVDAVGDGQRASGALLVGQTSEKWSVWGQFLDHNDLCPSW